MPILLRRLPRDQSGTDLATRRTSTGVVLAVTAIVALSACSSGSNTGAPAKVDGSSASSGYNGDVLPAPITLTDAAKSAVFHDSTGATATLGSMQHGRLMLLYFGYTHCPDVCPTTMADLGQALRQVGLQVRQRTQVVFVTSDPHRDTPPVMKAWLANFDVGLPVSFVGLTASLAQTDRVAESLGVPLSPPVTEANGSVSVEHGAQTLAFIAGKAKLVWLAGTTVASYTHDIATLAADGNLS